VPGPVSLPYTMWGHPSLLLRDIAVNESDQQRVSDSGAIRSGLVPQLKHNAIHRRSPAWRTLLECTPALAEALQPPVSGECAILSPSSEDVTASMQDQRFLVLVGARRRMSRRAPTGAQRDIPSIPRYGWSAVTLHRLRRGFLLRLPPCGPPLSVRWRSIAWSFRHDVIQPDHADGRVRADGARQSLLELWLRNGRLPDLVEAGILCPARCTRGSRRCLNGWL
jgi:hypothetical protein